MREFVADRFARIEGKAPRPAARSVWMARATTSRGASSETKCSPRPLISLAPSPPERLGRQRRGIAADIDGGRVELHEFRVGDQRARARGHGHALGDRGGRIGGDGEQPARAAGGEHDFVRFDHQIFAVYFRRNAADCAVRIFAERVSMRARSTISTCLAARTARISASMIALPARSPRDADHAWTRVCGFQALREFAVRTAVERHAERDQVHHARRALAREHFCNNRIDQACSRFHRVQRVQIGAIALRPAQPRARLAPKRSTQLGRVAHG